MKRPRDKSFINDPRAPAFMGAFGIFFLWASYHTLEGRKLTVGFIVYAAILCLVSLSSIVPLALQLVVFVKKRKAAASASKEKEDTR